MAYLSPDDLARTAEPIVRELCSGGAQRIITMPGGASLRRYHRVEVEQGTRPSLVIMELGDNATRSDEVVKGGAPAELPFINVQRYLHRAGVAVPDVFRFDEARGLVYLEDLGDVTFESRVAAASDDVRRRYYQTAIDQLVVMQRWAGAHPDPSCVAFSRGFDFDLLLWELDHFREYGLEAQGLTPTPIERAELDRQFRAIATELADSPRGFVHRDYQSRNLMVQDAPATTPRSSSDAFRLRVIDFQDALLGTAAYDLVGLLRDSYVALAPSLLDDLVAYHARRAEVPLEPFTALFDLQTVQRKLKDAGRFVFIDRVKKNPGFLVHIPNSLTYVARAVGRLPRLASLREILARHLPQFREHGGDLS
jgi:aminoglycoside/choline kinase family phosphotransferase